MPSFDIFYQKIKNVIKVNIVVDNGSLGSKRLRTTALQYSNYTNLKTASHDGKCCLIDV